MARRSFSKILIANRGEIAVRILRTAKACGYRTVAVYSEADAGAPHVTLADEAVLIGPSPVAQSYLDPERLIRAAEKTQADAIHPGYGFLSENAAFARACLEAGLVFIGPSVEAIALMGNKAEAKRRMIAAGVPCVPGYEGADQSDDAFSAAAQKIGFPVMVKAAAGGGGRGMRLVTEAAHLTAALATARSEAKNAFGSDELILERAVLRPRHVEFQVFGDAHGHVVHLFERDCSVQRRHQKVVEEAPCPVMTPALRARMGSAAVEVARTIGYEGAGTVEFLLDGAENFYFLEMNTRLQVEHPVSECITGLDLVALQFAVAQGEALPFTQDELKLSGHAIEVRLYAEDPANGFLPASGKISAWRPAQGEGVRIDHGIGEEAEISPFYDPMLAKIIAHGSTRDEARRRLIHGLEETMVFGLPTNRDFLIDILKHEVFAAGRATTAFLVEDFTAAERARTRPTMAQAALAAVLQWRAGREAAAAKAVVLNPELLDWTSAGQRQGRFLYDAGDFEVTALGADRYRVHAGDHTFAVDILAAADGIVRARLDGVALSCHYHADGGRLALALGGRQFEFDNQLLHIKGAEDAAQGGHVRAPMHGRILRLHVETGVEVREGAALAVLEAMKMEHEVTAAVAGRVMAVHVAIGDQVAANSILIEIEKG